MDGMAPQKKRASERWYQYLRWSKQVDAGQPTSYRPTWADLQFYTLGIR